MPKFWGFHHGWYEGEINRHYEGREREYKAVPADAEIKEHDVVFLFNGNEYLYGWGTVTNIGKPYSERSGQLVKDVSVDQRVLVQQLASIDQIKQTPAFRDTPWEKKAGVLSSFNQEQIETLINFLPRDRSRPRIPSIDIPNGWESVEQERKLEGGQGSITKIRRKADGSFGALKRLHSEHLYSTERRYRMQQEVNALLILGGSGTPIVLEANTESWQEIETPLYVVMEWIDGLTLTDYIGRTKAPLDVALQMTLLLLDIIDRCHEYSIFHRDIKPDNVILRSGDPGLLVLVDFGMAWSKASENEQQGFMTRPGQELGNRFLRLPEYAPGRKVRDSRSDLTMVVGLLFYMITNRAPRQLLDEQMRMPHVALSNAIPESVRTDSRWSALERLFGTGFQYRIEDRFQTSNQLRQAISRLSGSQEDKELLADEFARLKELLESPHVRLRTLAAGHITNATTLLHESLRAYFAESELKYEDSWSVEKEREIGSILRCGVYRDDVKEVRASVDHMIKFVNSQYVASYLLEGGTGNDYYSGPAVDPESLNEAIRQQATRIARELVLTYRERLIAKTGQD